MTEPTYTMQQALDQMHETSKDIAHLIGVANIDVADEYGEANAEPRETWLRPSPDGGDHATVYARRLARMLLERLIVDYVIEPREESQPTARCSLCVQRCTNACAQPTEL